MESSYLDKLTGTGNTACSQTASSSVTDKAESLRAASSAGSERDKCS